MLFRSMSEALGPATLESVRAQFLPEVGVASRGEYSERTGQAIDDEVRKLLAEAQSRVRGTLTVRRPQLETLAKVLLRQEVVDRATLTSLLSEGRTDPAAPQVDDGATSNTQVFTGDRSVESRP